ncbi:uncharacterized protein ZBAI_03528 [Zygosaccharomyces bailii ISA1307]|nr:uncharacterized protein ZBAI_03528 [Zygosaccharomyces bailii ISA1307]
MQNAVTILVVAVKTEDGTQTYLHITGLAVIRFSRTTLVSSHMKFSHTLTDIQLYGCLAERSKAPDSRVRLLAATTSSEHSGIVRCVSSNLTATIFLQLFAQNLRAAIPVFFKRCHGNFYRDKRLFIAEIRCHSKVGHKCNNIVRKFTSLTEVHLHSLR